jgi:hypothetical protein
LLLYCLYRRGKNFDFQAGSLQIPALSAKARSRQFRWSRWSRWSSAFRRRNSAFVQPQRTQVRNLLLCAYAHIFQRQQFHRSGPPSPLPIARQSFMVALDRVFDFPDSTASRRKIAASYYMITGSAWVDGYAR